MQFLKQPLIIAPPSAESPEGMGFFLVFMALGFLAVALISLRRRTRRRYLYSTCAEEPIARHYPTTESTSELPDCNGACAGGT
jgi:hypothetical protein